MNRQHGKQSGGKTSPCHCEPAPPARTASVQSAADALYHLVHDYPGGAEALGLRLGIPNLSDQVNPHRRAKLAAEDAIRAEVFANDFRFLYAHAAACAHFPPVPMPDLMGGEQEPSFLLLARLASEFGDVMRAISERASDGDISDNDLREISQQWGELVQAGQQLIALFTQQNRQQRNSSKACRA